MAESKPIDDLLRNQIDAYFAGQLAEEEFRTLEARLREDAQARAYFASYTLFLNDLYMEQRANQTLLNRGISPGIPILNRNKSRKLLPWATVLAVVLALGFGAILTWRFVSDEPTIAWIVNAQDCQWGHASQHEKTLRSGSVLQVESGLAEIRFASGATLVLQGPAELTLHHAKAVQLKQGKLTANVPESAHGFEVLTPEGRVIDLGTSFGLNVQPSGTTDIVVFEGKVEAEPKGRQRIPLAREQSARLSGGNFLPTDPSESYVRAIVPPPKIVPRKYILDFKNPPKTALLDKDATPTGLTYRLPGTGKKIPPQDSRLTVNRLTGELELVTTNSDINHQVNMDEGEYFGIRLKDLGFTGSEDFEISVLFPDIPALRRVGQFGVYAGVKSDQVIRGGLISRKDTGEYTQFHVNNNGGKDTDSAFIGLSNTGDAVRITLRRIKNQYSQTVENLTAGNSSTLTIRHPTYLDHQPDIYVGLFGANTHSNEPKRLRIKEISVTVWTVQ